MAAEPPAFGRVPAGREGGYRAYVSLPSRAPSLLVEATERQDAGDWWVCISEHARDGSASFLTVEEARDLAAALEHAAADVESRRA